MDKQIMLLKFIKPESEFQFIHFISFKTKTVVKVPFYGQDCKQGFFFFFPSWIMKSHNYNLSNTPEHFHSKQYISLFCKVNRAI